jgi:hypothetical protein
MAVLHLENVPDQLMQRIAEIATARQLPIRETVLQWLEQAVGDQSTAQGASRNEVREILEWIKRNRVTPRPGTPDSVELLREDRER